MSVNPGAITKPVVVSYKYITDNYVIDPKDDYNNIFADISADKTVTLPDIDVVVLGYTIWIKRLDNTSHTLMILPVMGQNIDTYSSIDMSGNEELAVTAVGAGWAVMRGGQNFVTSSRDLSTVTPILGSIVYNTNPGYGIGVGYYISDGVTWSAMLAGAMVHTAGVVSGNGSSGSPIVLVPGVIGNVTQYNGSNWNLGQSLTAYTVYVDAANGNDLTAQPFNPYFPYATIDAACVYASSNTAVNLVYVRNGVYTVNASLCTGSGFSMYFEPSYVACNVAPFNDGGVNSPVSIYGYGEFVLNNCPFMSYTTATASLTDFQFGYLSGTTVGDCITITGIALNWECTDIGVSGSGTENLFNVTNSLNTFNVDWITLNNIKFGLMSGSASNNYFHIVDLRLRGTCALLTDNSTGFTSVFIDSMRKVLTPVVTGFTISGSAGATKIRINQAYSYSNYSYNITGAKQVLIDELYSYPSIVVDGTTPFIANIEATFYSINSSGLPNILNVTGSVGGTINIKAKSAVGSVVNNTTNPALNLTVDIDSLTVAAVPILTTGNGKVNYTAKNISLTGSGTSVTVSGGTLVMNLGSYVNSTSTLFMNVLGGVATLNASDITLTGSLASVNGGSLTTNIPSLITGTNAYLYTAGASSVLNINSTRTTTQTANNHVLSITFGVGGVVRLQNAVFITPSSANTMVSNFAYGIYAYPSVMVTNVSSNILYTVGSEIVNASII